jgi:hypothetical protein
MTADSSATNAAARVLKGGAVAFLVIGAGISVWIIQQWIDHPEVRASQFGFEAPLWPAVLAFVVLATGAGVRLLWIAANRARREDLYAQRHRRRPSDDVDAS